MRQDVENELDDTVEYRLDCDDSAAVLLVNVI